MLLSILIPKGNKHGFHLNLAEFLIAFRTNGNERIKANTQSAPVLGDSISNLYKLFKLLRP